MYQNVKRTCRVLFLLINPIVLWRSRCRRRRRRCLSSLLCFVHGQGQKREQKPRTKNFVEFHNHSPPLTMFSPRSRMTSPAALQAI